MTGRQATALVTFPASQVFTW